MAGIFILRQETVVNRRSRSTCDKIKSGIALIAACSATIMFASTYEQMLLPTVQGLVKKEFEVNTGDYTFDREAFSNAGHRQQEYLNWLDHEEEGNDPEP